jgi:hypothetical protein
LAPRIGAAFGAGPGVPTFAGSLTFGSSTISASPRFCPGAGAIGVHRSAAISARWTSSDSTAPTTGRWPSAALTRAIMPPRL